VIAAEVERRRSGGGTAADLTLIDRRIAALDRQRQNLVRAIALLDEDPDSAALMTRELTELTTQRKELEIERSAKAEAAADEEADTRRLTDLAVWCSQAAANLDRLTYAEWRMILEALGVTVRVWKQDHEPRWELEMAPLPVSPILRT